MTIKTTNKFSAEVRARAVRLVLYHEGDFTFFQTSPALEN